MKLYSARKTEQILRSLDGEIRSICSRYRLPPACLKAILFREMTEIDLQDLLADAVVFCNWQRAGLTGITPDLSGEKTARRSLLRKYDSSTGYAQIFAGTAILAIRFTAERGIASAEELGLGKGRQLSVQSANDRREIWLRLRKDRSFNLSCSALNLIFCAREMTGKTDWEHFTPEELKLTFTRYNADVRHITAYGETTYQSYLRYC